MSKESFPSETSSWFELAHLWSEYNSNSSFDTLCLYMVSHYLLTIVEKYSEKNEIQTPVFTEVLAIAHYILRCSELLMALSNAVVFSY